MGKSKINPDAVMEAVRESMFGLGNDGFCTECGFQQGGCEPDASGITCEDCGAPAVVGAEDLMHLGYAG